MHIMLKVVLRLIMNNNYSLRLPQDKHKMKMKQPSSGHVNSQGDPGKTGEQGTPGSPGQRVSDTIKDCL